MNSFIRFHNSLIDTINYKNLDRVMILLPRCLSKEMIDKIKEVSENNKFLCFIVPGGDLAREKIREHRPQAIIAVACERDLYSGLKDTPTTIPVYAIPNIRPEGPCKNTCINFKELDKAVKLFSVKQ